MKKLLVTTAVTLTATLFLTTGHAGNSGHGHGKKDQTEHRHRSKRNRGGNGGSAEISYSIDPGTCAVTVSSTKSLSNIVIKDSSGEKIMKWDDLSGKSFSDFGMYNALLADGSLYVKSGNNGTRGKRKRGLGAEIGATFRDELTACLDTPVVEICPSEITEVIDTVLASRATPDIIDTENTCEVYGSPGNAVVIYNGLVFANGNNVGVSYLGLDDSTVEVRLSLEQADACQLYTGRCDNYNNRL